MTEDAAPTTPEITLRTCVLLQWYSAPSILLIEPEMKQQKKNFVIKTLKIKKVLWKTF